MKSQKFIIVCAVLLTAFFMAACDWEWEEYTPSDTTSFNYDLRGTWESLPSTPAGVSGTLEIGTSEIGSRRIRITGYTGGWMFQPNTVPFNGFLKDIPLRGYSEKTKAITDGHEGIICIIMLDESEVEINYRYTSYWAGGTRVTVLQVWPDGQAWEETLRLQQD